MTSLRLGLQTLLDEKHFESELLDLQLLCGDGSKYTGQGMLVWDADKGIRMEAITDSAGSLVQRGFGVGAKPGELLRTKHCLRLSARTKWGDKVSIERLMPVGSHVHADNPNVVWKWFRVMFLVQVSHFFQ